MTSLYLSSVRSSAAMSLVTLQDTTVGGRTRDDVKQVISDYVFNNFKQLNPNATETQLRRERINSYSESRVLDSEDWGLIANKLNGFIFGPEYRPDPKWYKEKKYRDGRDMLVRNELSVKTYLDKLFAERADKN